MSGCKGCKNCDYKYMFTHGETNLIANLNTNRKK